MAKGRKTGGRRAGVPNKLTADVQALAREFTEDAIRTLAQIMNGRDNPTARVAAADKLLDRGWGRAKQTVTGEGEGGAIVINVATGVLRADD